jgi:hypothetical protein
MRSKTSKRYGVLSRKKTRKYLDKRQRKSKRVHRCRHKRVKSRRAKRRILRRSKKRYVGGERTESNDTLVEGGGWVGEMEVRLKENLIVSDKWEKRLGRLDINSEVPTLYLYKIGCGLWLPKNDDSSVEHKYLSMGRSTEGSGAAGGSAFDDWMEGRTTITFDRSVRLVDGTRVDDIPDIAQHRRHRVDLDFDGDRIEKTSVALMTPDQKKAFLEALEAHVTQTRRRSGEPEKSADKNRAKERVERARLREAAAAERAAAAAAEAEKVVREGWGKVQKVTSGAFVGTRDFPFIKRAGEGRAPAAGGPVLPDHF